MMMWFALVCANNAKYKLELVKNAYVSLCYICDHPLSIPPKPQGPLFASTANKYIGENKFMIFVKLRLHQMMEV